MHIVLTRMVIQTTSITKQFVCLRRFVKQIEVNVLAQDFVCFFLFKKLPNIL